MMIENPVPARPVAIGNRTSEFADSAESLAYVAHRLYMSTTKTAVFHGFLSFHSKKRRKLRKKLLKMLTGM
jgi:hypothetical protein